MTGTCTFRRANLPPNNALFEALEVMESERRAMENQYSMLHSERERANLYEFLAQKRREDARYVAMHDDDDFL